LHVFEPKIDAYGNRAFTVMYTMAVISRNVTVADKIETNWTISAAPHVHLSETFSKTVAVSA